MSTHSATMDMKTATSTSSTRSEKDILSINGGVKDVVTAMLDDRRLAVEVHWLMNQDSRVVTCREMMVVKNATTLDQFITILARDSVFLRSDGSNHGFYADRTKQWILFDVPTACRLLSNYVFLQDRAAVCGGHLSVFLTLEGSLAFRKLSIYEHVDFNNVVMNNTTVTNDRDHADPVDSLSDDTPTDEKHDGIDSIDDTVKTTEQPNKNDSVE